jgi:hypothetical protein
VTSCVSVPYVCESIAYLGILSPTKALVRLNSRCVLVGALGSEGMSERKDVGE